MGTRVRHHRRVRFLPPLAVALGVMLLLLMPVLDTVAQIVQVPPIQQPVQQLPTEEPDDRPGEIPTIDPDSDLPPRPTQAPPTELPTRPPRVTPTLEPAEPTDAPIEPTAAPSQESQALEIAPPHVTIHKGTCNIAIAVDMPFDPYGDASLDDFQAGCNVAQEPIEFTVTGEDGFAETVTTAGGEAQLDVTATKITIAETVPPDFAYPAVFCYSNRLAPFAGTPPVFQVSASWDMHPGESLDCWFYNIPLRDRAAVTVLKAVCPDDVSPVSDQLDPFTYCTEYLPGVEFTVTDASGPRPQLTDEHGFALWDDTIVRDDGTIELRETIPDGYGEPAFFCGPQQRLDPGEEIEGAELVPSVDGAITVPFADTGQHASMTCVVFNTTVGADTGHDVTILKYACPFGYDDTGKPIETILDECDKHPGTVEFTVAGEGGFSVTEQTISPDVPFALIDNVPAGPITISETVPSGYAALAAWCSDEVANDTLTNIQSQPLVNGNSIAWDYAEDAELSCIWLNVPTSPPAGDNQVIVHKWRCNLEDLGAYDTDWALDEYHAVCDEPMDGVDFTLTAPNGSFPQTTANGAVEWTGQPEGDFAIQETIPAYYGEPIVFCSIQIPNGGGPMVRVEAPGGLVEATFGVPGSTYTCEWFNVDVGPNSMRFWKHVCPDDVLMGQDLAYYEATCTLPQPNVDFTVTTANGTMTGATNFGGVVVFQPVPGGGVAIQETIPTGYGTPIVYCGISNEGVPVQPFTQVPAAGGAVDLTMPPLGHIDCHWFNIAGDPDGDGSVTVHKWECPEQPAKGTIVTWYPQNCTQAMDGVEFTLETVNGNSTGITAGGTVTFNGVPAGPIGIQETIPAGFGDPLVLCDLDGVPVIQSSVSGHYATAIGSGQTLTCTWYNVPGGPGDLTFIKHTCEPGYDPFAANADPYLDCPELTDGVEFTLSGPADATSTTGDVALGTASFGPLEPGTYTVTETVPAGTAQVFVLSCTGYIMGQLQPYPLSQDESLEIAVDAGEHLTCHWFNVPEDDGGTVSLTKYTCAGEAFVSELDCEIEEGGVTFDLLASDDSVVVTATTDGYGRITWTGLTPGDYWLAEHDGEWCHIAATPAEGGDTFGVNDGQETTVKVYNCGAIPGQPGDTPTKYPNTGAGPGGTAPQAMTFSQTDPVQVSEGDIIVFDEEGRIVRVINNPTPLDRLILVLQAIPAWVYVLTVIVVVAVVIHDRKIRDELPEIEARMHAPTIDRAVWLADAKPDRPSDRPAWFTGEPASPPSDRPAWMTGSPDTSTNR